VEAVIELRVAPFVTPAKLQDLARALNAKFPLQAPMQLTQFTAVGLVPSADQVVQPTILQSAVGHRLTNAGNSRVAQLRQDGFAYSHLAPYSKWSPFRSEAREIWSRFRALCPDSKLTRCALRFINRIDIPSEKVELEDYFQLYPQVPKSLPQQDVIGETLSLQMPQNDIGCMANVVQALVPPGKPGHVSILLDVDIFRLQIEDWDDDAAWSYLEKMRVRKNEIFEGCITDRTRELIDK